MQKRCFKCGQVKSLADFYKHKMMADGHLNKCKDCTRSDVAAHRLENIDKIRAYDRARGARQPAEYLSEYRRTHPKAYKAHQMVRYHVRSGNLHKQPCEVCGSISTVAHHDDYDKPLNVRWLCQAHHKQWHAEHGEGLNYA